MIGCATGLPLLLIGRFLDGIFTGVVLAIGPNLVTQYSSTGNFYKFKEKLMPAKVSVINLSWAKNFNHVKSLN